MTDNVLLWFMMVFMFLFLVLVLFIPNICEQRNELNNIKPVATIFNEDNNCFDYCFSKCEEWCLGPDVVNSDHEGCKND